MTLPEASATRQPVTCVSVQLGWQQLQQHPQLQRCWPSTLNRMVAPNVYRPYEVLEELNVYRPYQVLKELAAVLAAVANSTSPTKTTLPQISRFLTSLTSTSIVQYTPKTVFCVIVACRTCGEEGSVLQSVGCRPD
jgi:hypothetical protein